MPYHQNDLHGHRIRALKYLGGNISTWRKNETWIYFIHYSPFILTVNCVLLNQWVCFGGDIECSGFICAPP